MTRAAANNTLCNSVAWVVITDHAKCQRGPCVIILKVAEISIAGDECG